VPAAVTGGLDRRRDARVLTGAAGEGCEEADADTLGVHRTGVELGRRIAVVARRPDGHGAVLAARGRVAGVHRAGVVVVAVDGRPGRAGPGRADVPDGAGIAVVARGGVVHVRAARHRIAGVGGADVAIVAVDGRRTAVGERAAPGD